MKKACCRHVTIAMLISLLTACSGGDPSSPPPSDSSAPGASPPAAPIEPAAQTTVVTPAASPSPAAPPAASPPPAATPVASSAASPADTAPSYDVSCATDAKAAEQCQVDKDTYIGWRTFAGQCQVCHGGSALGSTFAPNLLDRFHTRVDYPRFVEVVTHGYTGQVGAMPAWKGNPNVEPHIDQLYRYLKARADGVLPAGRPVRKP